MPTYFSLDPRTWGTTLRRTEVSPELRGRDSLLLSVLTHPLGAFSFFLFFFLILLYLNSINTGVLFRECEILKEDKAVGNACGGKKLSFVGTVERPQSRANPASSTNMPSGFLGIRPGVGREQERDPKSKSV